MALREWVSGQVATATVATTATVAALTGPSVATVATVAVANPTSANPVEPAGLADGWRRRAATDAWHRDWTDARERGSANVTDATLADAVSRTVLAWNAVTGDQHTTADYLAHLCPADLADPELMTRDWLALYAWTLWHAEVQP